MRIDYSEPRQYSSGTTAPYTPRKAERPASGGLAFKLALLCIGFAVGFGAGWHLSQKSAKKAFRAAMEQQSLESTPAVAPKNAVSPPSGAAPAASQPGGSAPPPSADSKTGAASGQATPSGQVPLSFFESLPRGQKQTVLGSGINEKPKPAEVHPPTTPAGPAAPSAPAQSPPSVRPAAPAAPPAVQPPPKPAAVSPSASGFVVQVAAFNNRKEAELTRTKLAAKGYSASVVETNLNDKGTWFRVRIGRHLEKEAATEIATRIGGGAKVIPDLD